MAKPSWRPGAFAAAYPGPASDVGRAHKREAAAERLLYATAGVASAMAISDAGYGGECHPCAPGEMPRGCCGSPCGAPADSCCGRGTCTNCGPGEDDFDAVYPEVAAERDACHAYGAAVRDILADPDVDDVSAALKQAAQLHASGKLAALYAPQVPAKPMPDGSPAPARCPVCGAVVCITCHCSCACVSTEHEKPEMPAGEM